METERANERGGRIKRERGKDQGRKKEKKEKKKKKKKKKAPTGTKPTLIDPAVHLRTLFLQLLDPSLQIGQLALELLDLVGIRADGLVECLGQQIRHGLRLPAAHARRAHRVAQRSAAHAGVDAARVVVHGLRLLRLRLLLLLLLLLLMLLLLLLLSRVHVLVVGDGGVVELLLVFRGDAVAVAAGVGTLLVIVVGLGAGRGVVVNVRVGAGATLEEHADGKSKERLRWAARRVVSYSTRGGDEEWLDAATVLALLLGKQKLGWWGEVGLLRPGAGVTTMILAAVTRWAAHHTSRTSHTR